MAIWDHAVRVRSSNNLSAEARELADDLGMNRSQAVICLTQIRKMRSGERFSSYTNDETTRYFLSRFEEEGIEVLRRALDSFGQAIRHANERRHPVQECVALHKLFTLRLEGHDQSADAHQTIHSLEDDKIAELWQHVKDVEAGTAEKQTAAALAIAYNVVEGQRVQTTLSQMRQLRSGQRLDNFLNGKAVAYCLEKLAEEGPYPLARGLRALLLSATFERSRGNKPRGEKLIATYTQRLTEMDGLVAERLTAEIAVTAAMNEFAVNGVPELPTSSAQPVRKQVTTWVIDRDPKIKAARLVLAKGTCGNCQNVGPFRTADDALPFLEVHHIKPLADGGLDNLDNTIALCPNCHRASHYARQEDLPKFLKM